MDAADILGAPSRSNFQPRSRPQSEAAAKGLKGLNREIFALTGGASTGQAAPTSPTTPAFKKKKGSSKQVQWEWKAFTNSARKDGLVLRHWQKKGMQWDEYPFAKFNKTLKLLKYTDEDYASLLSQDDWSRIDTDNLMTLVQRFGMNFTLVHDRWTGEQERSLEHLKDRFYTIQRKLTAARDPEQEAPAGAAAGAAVKVDAPEENILMTKPYNLDYELQRKAYLERAYASSKRDEVMEQDIVEKARKIEAMMKKRKQEKRKAPDPANAPITPAEGKAVLRSQMFASPSSEEQSAVEKVLKGIGMDVQYAVSETQDTYVSMLGDVMTLLEWYKRTVKRKKELGLVDASRPPAEPAKASSSSEPAPSGRRDRERKPLTDNMSEAAERPSRPPRERKTEPKAPAEPKTAPGGETAVGSKRAREAPSTAPAAESSSKETRRGSAPAAEQDGAAPAAKVQKVDKSAGEGGEPAAAAAAAPTRRSERKQEDAAAAAAPAAEPSLERATRRSESVKKEDNTKAQAADSDVWEGAKSSADAPTPESATAHASSEGAESGVRQRGAGAADSAAGVTPAAKPTPSKEKKQDATPQVEEPRLTRRQREEQEKQQQDGSADAGAGNEQTGGNKRKLSSRLSGAGAEATASTSNSSPDLPLEKRLRKR